MIKYSFVIPTYNNRYNVVNSLECVFKQNADGASYEVIVVDDGSSDGLVDSMEEYTGRSNFRYIRLERDACSSRSRARNVGWRSARGKFIVFIDSDILIDSNYLRQLDRYFDVNPDAIIIGNRLHLQKPATKEQITCGDIFRLNPFGRENFGHIDYRYVVYSAQSFNAKAIQDSWLHAYSCNMAVDKSRLIGCGGFDEKILDWGIEDIELAYRLVQGGAVVLINPFLEVLHQSADHRDDLAISDKRIKKYLENINYFLRKHPLAMIHFSDPIAQLVTGTMYQELTGLRPVVAHYGENIQDTKSLLQQKLAESSEDVVLYDFTNDSGLDVWVQTLSKDSHRVLYFPMSRKVDVKKMMAYISAEREKANRPAAATALDFQNVQSAPQKYRPELSEVPVFS